MWVGVHFGSRGFGHKTATIFLALAEGLPFDARASEGGWTRRPSLLPRGLRARRRLRRGDDSSPAATPTPAATSSARRCCAHPRRRAAEEVHNHHNYAWREEHGGETAWVVRKGATPAFPGQRGFVGATMGEPAVILEGVESDTAREALYSTVHGAGRAMSRRQAAGKPRTVEHARSTRRATRTCLPQQRTQDRIRRIDFDAVRAELAAQGIELRGGAADEAPGAYKRLADVLAHHAGTVRVLHTLRPLGVAMAGADTLRSLQGLSPRGAAIIPAMPWIQPLDEAAAPEASRATADAHAATGGRMTNMKWTLAHEPAALDALLEWYPLHDQVAAFLGERRTNLFCHAISVQTRLPDLLDVLPPPADRRRRGP